MSTNAAVRDRIDSWKEIATYLGRDVRTVIRWERDRGLPVHRIPGGGRRGVFAFRQEIDAWLAGIDLGDDGVHEASSIAGPIPLAPAVPDNPEFDASGADNMVVRPRHTKKARTGFAIGAILLALAVIAVCFTYLTASAIHVPVLSDREQLTSNGQEKYGLICRGDKLYFSQEQSGRFALVEMTLPSGSIRPLWNPQQNVEPVDLSPDGKSLLALTRFAEEQEQEVWIVPLNGEAPHRLSNVTAHAAAWSPDGRWIAYATETSLGLIGSDGSSNRSIASLAFAARHLDWSKDGKRIRFLLSDRTEKFVSWGEASGLNLSSITYVPLPYPILESEFWTRGPIEDSQLFPGQQIESRSMNLHMLKMQNHWWEPGLQMSIVAQGRDINPAGIAYSSTSKKLFTLNEFVGRTAYEQFDEKTQEFKQILPGISGSFIDFSRRGDWVGYASFPGEALWISRIDGTDARQLTTPPDLVQLIRWSPDGKKIAYMKSVPGHPWRIFIQPLVGGPAEEASNGDEDQGAPTWSPDGRYITYGGVRCEKTNTCAIHRIDLSTHIEETLPGSEGLYTARWSPDGRFIAAIHLSHHWLMILDLNTMKWRKLAENFNGNDLDWSRNSKFLYSNIHGDQAGIVRIGIADGKAEKVLGLSSVNKFDITTGDDLQFSLTPDDAIVLHRRVHAAELVQYNLR